MSRLPLMGFILPGLTRIFSDGTIRAVLRRFPHQEMQNMMDISDTMTRRSQEIIDQKKEALKKGDEALVHPSLVEIWRLDELWHCKQVHEILITG